MAEQTIPGGVLIAVEGIDGSGKTTLVAKLREYFQSAGVRTLSSKEPTHGPWGEKMRASAQDGRLTPVIEMDLMLRDRRDHVEKVIGPGLAAGAVVILDRYYFSSIAYQGSGGIDPFEIERLNLEFAPKPDLTLLIDTDVEVGLARIRARGDVANAFERPDTLADCRELFVGFLPERPQGVRIDGNAPADDVFHTALGLAIAACAEKIRLHSGFTVQSAESIQRLLA